MSAKKLLLVTVWLIAGYKFYKARNPKIPEKVMPATGFELERYLGRWSEVARVDNRFEKAWLKLLQNTLSTEMVQLMC